MPPGLLKTGVVSNINNIRHAVTYCFCLHYSRCDASPSVPCAIKFTLTGVIASRLEVLPDFSCQLSEPIASYSGPRWHEPGQSPKPRFPPLWISPPTFPVHLTCKGYSSCFANSSRVACELEFAMYSVCRKPILQLSACTIKPEGAPASSNLC